MENKIGKKVWLLDGTLERGFTLKSKETFIVKEVKSGQGLPRLGKALRYRKGWEKH